MSQLTLYGTSGSRALRSLWAIEEVGVDYNHEPTSFKGDAQSDEYRAVNPNARIPCLIDGDITVFESMAINLYLAKNYGDLYPSDKAAEAHTLQWSIWGISEIEPLQMQIVAQKFFVSDEKRNNKLIASSERQLARPLAVLDSVLADREWLVADRFTVADLNLAGVMLLLAMVKFDTSNYDNVTRWHEACCARPALAKARALP